MSLAHLSTRRLAPSFFRNNARVMFTQAPSANSHFLVDKRSRHFDMEKVIREEMTGPYTAETVDKLAKEGKIGAIAAKSFHHTIEHREEHKKQGQKWNRYFYYICCPIMGITLINTAYHEYHHMKHIEEHGLEYTPYKYMRIRNKKFFWGDGDTSLFHNPKINYDPKNPEAFAHAKH